MHISAINLYKSRLYILASWKLFCIMQIRFSRELKCTSNINNSYLCPWTHLANKYVTLFLFFYIKNLIIPMPVLPKFGSTLHPHLHFNPFFSASSSIIYDFPGASFPRRCCANAKVISSFSDPLSQNTLIRLSSWKPEMCQEQDIGFNQVQYNH